MSNQDILFLVISLLCPILMPTLFVIWLFI